MRKPKRLIAMLLLVAAILLLLLVGAMKLAERIPWAGLDSLLQ